MEDNFEFEKLCRKYPHISFKKKAKRDGDNITFNSGDYIKTPTKSISQIIAFDEYDLPIKSSQEDYIETLKLDGWITDVFKSRTKRITRAVLSWGIDYVFEDIQRIDFYEKNNI